MKRIFLGTTIVALGFAPLFGFAQYSNSRWGVGPDIQSEVDALSDSPTMNLPIPILLGFEVSDLTRNFGDPRSSGRTHEGLDMLAPDMTPVVSPTDAVVTRIGDGPSSGLYVRTANPGGERFVYMHLTRIAQGIERGTVLKRGDVLGFVGNTGNASGGPPHLHFEIRKNVATDPYPRLITVFTLQEKMSSVQQALDRSSDAGLPALLASEFHQEFIDAQAQGVPIPESITLLLAKNGFPSEGATQGQESVYLKPGDTGSEVVMLQQFLISRSTGISAERLKAATATGYFGPITQAFLRTNGLAQ